MVNVAQSKSISISTPLQGARWERAAHEKRFRGSNHISLERRRASHLPQTTKQQMELCVGASTVARHCSGTLNTADVHVMELPGHDAEGYSGGGRVARQVRRAVS